MEEKKKILQSKEQLSVSAVAPRVAVSSKEAVATVTAAGTRTEDALALKVAMLEKSAVKERDFAESVGSVSVDELFAPKQETAAVEPTKEEYVAAVAAAPKSEAVADELATLYPELSVSEQMEEESEEALEEIADDAAAEELTAAQEYLLSAAHAQILQEVARPKAQPTEETPGTDGVRHPEEDAQASSATRGKWTSKKKLYIIAGVVALAAALFFFPKHGK